MLSAPEKKLLVINEKLSVCLQHYSPACENIRHTAQETAFSSDASELSKFRCQTSKLEESLSYESTKPNTCLPSVLISDVSLCCSTNTPKCINYILHLTFTFKALYSRSKTLLPKYCKRLICSKVLLS